MMQLTIDGAARDLIPIRDFRAAHGLPPDFGVAGFEPKDYTGLGRIDRAGAELNRVRAAMLDGLPPGMTPPGWLSFLPDYARFFEAQLYAINTQVGLKDAEIGFAVSGLSDVLHQYAYALIRGMNASPAPFRQVYADWLEGSVKVFSEVYPYRHGDDTWRVQIFAHAYGRAGLVVRMAQATAYVYDPALACPAEGFMAGMLAEIAAGMEVAGRTTQG